MQLIVDPRLPKPLYGQIMDEVRRLIVLGELRAHDALPSVRQLAADLRINHNTIVQAYRELEREGLVYVRRGQGTFVADRVLIGEERARILADVVERALADARRNGISPDELLEALTTQTKRPGAKSHEEDYYA